MLPFWLWFHFFSSFICIVLASGNQHANREEIKQILRSAGCA